MGVTFITRIYATIGNAVDYVIRDKVVLREDAMKKQLEMEALNKAEDYIKNAIDYISKDKNISEDDKKNEIVKTLTSTLNCRYNRAKKEFEIVREQFREIGKKGIGKDQKEILGYHVWQSFEEKIDKELSNEIGVKLAKELYGDYQCVISTHTNTEHTHNHIVFNATSFKTGKKYNICTANTKKLREVSDRLCAEYGLKVLEETKDMNLKWYKDKKGNKKCFESTKGKAEAKGKNAIANVSDYRNYEAYELDKDFKERSRTIVKSDIDKYIHLSKSLDELIINLENIGYEVKNRNSKGNLLKYISFKPPTYTNYIRGKADILGEEYTREGIEKKINSYSKQMSVDNKKEAAQDKPSDSKQLKIDIDRMNRNRKNFNPKYEYGRTNIDEIDENYKDAYSKERKEYIKLPRTEVERYVVKHTKQLNKGKKSLDNIYTNNKSFDDFKSNQSKLAAKNAKEKIYIQQINENLRALSFIEERNIKSFDQICDTVKSLYEKKDEIKLEFVKIKKMLELMSDNISIIEKYNNLKTVIKNNEKDVDYNLYEAEGDKKYLKQYERILKERGLLDKVEMDRCIEKYASFTKRYNDLQIGLVNINEMLLEYDTTIKTLDRIDKEYGQVYDKDIEAYYKIKNKEKER